MTPPDFCMELAREIPRWAQDLGFQQAGIATTDLAGHEAWLKSWLGKGHAGEMAYMSRHGTRRSRPAELIPGTRSVITVRMNYLPEHDAGRVLASDRKAYVSRYALGRDYHKVIRRRLVHLWGRIEDWLAERDESGFNGRVFTDSAPVLEKALAEEAGLGWIGKNTLLLNRDAGSWFFLGEIYTDLPLPPSVERKTNHCGSCTACMDICPTGAIIAPYELDARRCISYLTIEKRGTIPVEFRAAIGNRIFGCDDCQLVCPWNRYAQLTGEPDFSPRHGLDQATLLELFAWDEKAFLQRTEGSAVRRTGYDGWLRNIAVALGNSPSTPEAIAALKARQSTVPEMVGEHIAWAIVQLEAGRTTSI